MNAKYELTNLEQLESEAIFVIREVAAQFERPSLLFFRWKRFDDPASHVLQGICTRENPFPDYSC